MLKYCRRPEFKRILDSRCSSYLSSSTRKKLNGKLLHVRASTTSAVETEFAQRITLDGLSLGSSSVSDKTQVNNTASENSAQHTPSPAELDAGRFRIDQSVSNWANYAKRPWIEDQNGGGVLSVVQRMSDISADFVRDPAAAAYWAYHAARLSFFVSQAVTGLLAYEASDRAQNLSIASLVAGGSNASSNTSTSGSENQPAPSIFSRLMKSGGDEVSVRAKEAFGVWQQDLSYIQSKYYKMPWDMTTLTHQQYNPFFMAARTSKFVQESVMTLSRRKRNTPDPVWIKGPSLYPQYYTNTYHYQTDGWFSEKSADVYEHSTETLFFGRQDAMQRSSLVPISEYISSCGKPASELKLLEVAAGTGRFHTFIKDNWPEMPSVVSDLSPFYLSKARANIEYWRSQTRGGRVLGGGPDGANVEYLQTAAESIAAADSSFDIVVVVYLFHELPEAIRRRAVSEFYRVLKPGGLVVFNDSMQIGDRPEWDNTVGLFGNFNEPYYRNYVMCDIGGMFEEAGFQPELKLMSSVSKVLSFMKPNVM
ncbi:hypothetical protein CEUSTIGMA_g2545.t1 [Chlamydomonas eustigma]|uniref:Methyltransferase type 11 domain-containing protein n=1 Tax=Chlamydomonas eustigma TaxID=1157962 RepID=A0A250WWA8_9CHLO|nr:hypothetical protein CEUSTIGMA_g2545.t1 [Chlamydomonas eustigma]|eukprot:GAX75101.1 hypothetical protein CEUSTIGMA_g2545.t1 [Chlamydomonas eustigma]